MKNVVKTDQAPGAIGPYSQGIQVGDMYFFSGQIPLVPSTGEMPEGIEAQAPFRRARGRGEEPARLPHRPARIFQRAPGVRR